MRYSYPLCLYAIGFYLPDIGGFYYVNFPQEVHVGVITEKSIPHRSAIEGLIVKLDDAFESDKCSKVDIVNIIRQYLPNFEHIETGKSLDGKM